MKRRNLILGGTLVTLIAALGFGQAVLQASVDAQAVQAPMFEVDPMWPKPLPNHWILGSAIGVGVDSRDHVFIIHRGLSTLNERTEAGSATDPKTGECCSPAPPILEFDPDGNLINSWGGPGDAYTWPNSNHGISVDDKDNVWIGGNNPGDSHVLKFTHDGKFLAQFGVPGQDPNSNAMDHFGRVANGGCPEKHRDHHHQRRDDGHGRSASKGRCGDSQRTLRRHDQYGVAQVPARWGHLARSAGSSWRGGGLRLCTVYYILHI